MTVACPACGAENRAGAKFCNECAGKLPASSAPAAGPADAERKMVTVLFSDVTGYTSMSETLDPEETREIMGEVFRQAAEIIGRYGGTIEKFIGDAIMAIFGVPHAHEDDPLRAVRAALELHAAVDALSPPVEAKIGRPIALHSGVNTGMVVTGELKFDKGTAGPLGDTINVAARLMNDAEAGRIHIGGATQRFVASRVALEALGERTFKGKAEPLAVYRVVGLSGADAKPVDKAQRSVLVGRHEEAGKLRAAVERLRDGVGGVVTITGGAGTGKTRLVEDLQASLPEEVQWREGRAYAYTDNIPFFPLVDLLNRAWGIVDGDSAAEVRQKVEAAIGMLLDDVDSVLPTIAPLYAFGVDEGETLNPESFQRRVQEAMSKLLDALARRAPTVVCLQDLHWADPSSLTVLRGIVASLEAPALIICVTRPGKPVLGEAVEATLGERHAAIEIGELSPRQTEEMIQALLDARALPAGLVAFIQQRSGGNPFFIEEVVASLVETDLLARDGDGWRLAKPLAEADVPDTVQGVVAARIDRLDRDHKRVLMDAAVIGREFVRAILARVSDAGDAVDGSLVELQSGDLIREKAIEPDLEYIFKHAVTQEVAYNGLLRKQRRLLHQRVGEAIEELFTDRIAEHVEALALHFERGGDTARAVKYLTQSGKRAVARYALDEAEAFYRRAYDLLVALPERTVAQDRALVELLIESALLHYYAGTFADLAELLDAHQDAATRVGDDELLAMYTAWRGFAHQNAGDMNASIERLLAALELAERAGSERAIAYACTWLCFGYAWTGHPDKARRFGARAQALAPRLPGDQYIYFKSMAALAHTDFFEGDTRALREKCDALIAYGRRTGNVRAEGMGHLMNAYLAYALGDYAAAVAATEAMHACSVDPYYRGIAGAILGVFRSLVNELAVSGDILAEAKAHFESARNTMFLPWVGLFEALFDLDAGRLSQGMRGLAEARRRAEEVGFTHCVVAGRTLEALTYSMIARGEGDVSLGVLLRNPGFIFRHAIGARGRAIRLLEAPPAPGVSSAFTLYDPILQLELARVLAHAKRRDEARAALARCVSTFEARGADGYLAQAREIEAQLTAR